MEKFQSFNSDSGLAFFLLAEPARWNLPHPARLLNGPPLAPRKMNGRSAYSASPDRSGMDPLDNFRGPAGHLSMLLQGISQAGCWIGMGSMNQERRKLWAWRSPLIGARRL
jgi:hypothetical protein